MKRIELEWSLVIFIVTLEVVQPEMETRFIHNVSSVKNETFLITKTKKYIIADTLGGCFTIKRYAAAFSPPLLFLVTVLESVLISIEFLFFFCQRLQQKKFDSSSHLKGEYIRRWVHRYKCTFTYSYVVTILQIYLFHGWETSRGARHEGRLKLSIRSVKRIYR